MITESKPQPQPESGADTLLAGLPESGEFFVEMVWWDGKPYATHIRTSRLSELRQIDESGPFLSRTWSRVTLCDNMYACTHSYPKES